MSMRWALDHGRGRMPALYTNRELVALICDAQISDSAAIFDVDSGENYSLSEWRKTFGQIPEECGLSNQESQIAKMLHGFGTGTLYSAVQICQIMKLPLEECERVARDARRKIKGLPVAGDSGSERSARPDAAITRTDACEASPPKSQDSSLNQSQRLSASKPSSPPVARHPVRQREGGDWIGNNGGGLWILAFALLWVAAFVSCISRPYHPGPSTPLDDFDGFTQDYIPRGR
jgi:hypothetical protein